VKTGTNGVTGRERAKPAFDELRPQQSGRFDLGFGVRVQEAQRSSARFALQLLAAEGGHDVLSKPVARKVRLRMKKRSFGQRAAKDWF